MYGSDSLFSFTQNRKALAPTLQSVLVEGRTEELQFSPCYDVAAPGTRPDFLLFSPIGTSLLSTRWTSCSLFPSVFPSFIVTESQKQLAYAFLPSQPLREQCRYDTRVWEHLILKSKNPGLRPVTQMTLGKVVILFRPRCLHL